MYKRIVCYLTLASCVSILFGCSDTQSNREAVAQKLILLRTQYQQNPTNSESLDQIREILNSNWSFARTYACTELGRLGPLAEPAVPDLIRALQSGDGFVEREAARALGEIGPSAFSAVPALVEKLKLEQDDVAWFSAESLGKIGSQASPALPDLERAANSKDSLLAEFAQVAIVKIRQSEEDAENPKD